jgi:uncharacterized protein (DUF58 family)
MILNRRYHLHWPGLVYIGITVLIGIGAINSQNNLLFIVLGIAVGALVFSGLMSGPMLMGLRITRNLVAPASVGEPVVLRYTVSNSNRLVPAFGLTLTEERSRSDRWASLINMPRGFVAHVGQRATSQTVVRTTTHRRGRAELSAVVMTTSFPFGIFRKSVRFRQSDEVLVLPRLFQLRAGALEELLGSARTGHSTSGRRGRGEEFWGLREYVPGDSRKLVAWKSSARTDRLVVRQHSDELASVLTVCLLVDGSEQSRDDDERAISLAASVVVDALDRGRHVGLLVPQHGIAIGAASAAQHRAALLQAMAEIDLDATAAPPARAMRRLSGLGQDACLAIAPGSGGHPLMPGAVPSVGAEQMHRFVHGAEDAT